MVLMQFCASSAGLQEEMSDGNTSRKSGFSTQTVSFKPFIIEHGEEGEAFLHELDNNGCRIQRSVALPVNASLDWEIRHSEDEEAYFLQSENMNMSSWDAWPSPW